MGLLTTLLVVDRKTLEQLEISLPTWRRNRPEIFRGPLVCAYDRALGTDELRRLWQTLGEAQIKRVAWPPPEVHDYFYADQRERMLTAFLACAAKYVETPWWLKIDTDVIATTLGPLYDPAWFTEQDCETWGSVEAQSVAVRGVPVLVAPAWRYTKNRDGRPWLTVLDDWGEGRESLKSQPRLNIPEHPGQVRVGHRRHCSWFAFYRTDWTREIVSYLTRPWKLPVPSQDTYAHYCAARRRDPFLLVSMKHRGLTNCSKLKSLRETANGVL